MCCNGECINPVSNLHNCGECGNDCDRFLAADGCFGSVSCKFEACVVKDYRCTGSELCDFKFDFTTLMFTGHPVCYDPDIYKVNWCTGHCAHCTSDADCCGTQKCFDACGSGHDSLFCVQDRTRSFCTDGGGDCGQ